MKDISPVGSVYRVLGGKRMQTLRLELHLLLASPGIVVILGQLLRHGLEKTKTNTIPVPYLFISVLHNLKQPGGLRTYKTNH